MLLLVKFINKTTLVPVAGSKLKSLALHQAGSKIKTLLFLQPAAIKSLTLPLGEVLYFL